MTLLFVDANIPIYASGSPHPLKEPSVAVLDLVADNSDLFVTDAEVLQELVRRYLALNIWAQGQGVFSRFAVLMQHCIESVHAEDVVRAASLASEYQRLSARDLLHLAVMLRIGADRIITADRDFDSVPLLRRLDPSDVSVWGRELGGT